MTSELKWMLQTGQEFGITIPRSVALVYCKFSPLLVQNKICGYNIQEDLPSLSLVAWHHGSSIFLMFSYVCNIHLSIYINVGVFTTIYILGYIAS